MAISQKYIFGIVDLKGCANRQYKCSRFIHNFYMVVLGKLPLKNVVLEMIKLSRNESNHNVLEDSENMHWRLLLFSRYDNHRVISNFKCFKGNGHLG